MSTSALATANHYYRLFTSPWRKLPDFIIVGAQKAGTSSLFYYLSQHPELRVATQKEIHYYNYYRLRGKNLNWYRSFFPLMLSSRKTGEASPYYLFDAAVPQRIKQDMPDVKLIMLLRNPIDRAYSAYNMNARRARDRFPTFEQAIANQDMSQEASCVYLWRGLYAQHIRHWLRHFPHDQLLFIKSEDFFADPRNTLQKVYEFLGIVEAYPSNTRPQEVGSYSDLHPDTRKRLQAYYAKPNRELTRLLGETFSWQ